MVQTYDISEKSFEFFINYRIVCYDKMFLKLFTFISIIVYVEYINIIINGIQNIKISKEFML